MWKQLKTHDGDDLPFVCVANSAILFSPSRKELKAAIDCLVGREKKIHLSAQYKSHSSKMTDHQRPLTPFTTIYAFTHTLLSKLTSIHYLCMTHI